ncbi:branched-chain amino acid ABC transporter permease [Mesorhizobium sp. INR15]|uniref:branched-chain amino acid ABC transporter permease n=1 Tax=Mesorhizobium sp. INR15 TaxID=2654248 RepID=UPI001AEF2292|nr:branched-chain amino acid ABC transporter permease [Mesorhizobium sp. INR15]
MDQILIFINAYLVPGIVSGSIYALGAIGLTLLFGVLRFTHFAHGDVMTAGAYFALTFVGLLGLHPVLALPIAMLCTSVLCLGINHFFYRPLMKRPSLVLTISSFGVALMIRASIQLLYGVESHYYVRGIQRSTEFFGTFRIVDRHIWIVCCAVVLMAALHLLLTYTRLGKAMRAVSDSPDLARLTGISTSAIVKATWVIGGSLAAVAGVFLGWDGFIQANMGWDLLLPMSAAAILGGLGRPYGAMVGGLVIALPKS